MDYVRLSNMEQITNIITIDESSINNIHNILNNYGVCIVKNVLDENECNRIISGMCSDFNHVTSRMSKPFNVSDITTWDTLKSLYPIDGMLYQHWGLGQSQTVWDVRMNNKVINIFSKIYHTNDLLVSFDGVAFGLPPEITGNGWYNNDRWHFDQSLNKPNFECVQGWVNAFDTDIGDASIAVMIGSHKLHSSYGQCLRNNGVEIKNDDWMRIDDVTFFTSNGCIPYRVVAPKGSLVLWDSRTLHFGCRPLNGRPKINYRMLIYLCYTPSSLITEANRKRKIDIFNKKGKQGEMRMTNHYPHRPVMFSETPFLRGAPLPTINPLPYPVIKPEYMHLIGYK